MEKNTQRDRKLCNLILIVLVLVAAAIRILIALCDESTLITKTVSDDSFYYFQIARNAASGAGITFDGVEPANGFHPLWFILLLPVYLLFGSDLIGSLHVALVLEALLDVGAGLFIFEYLQTLFLVMRGSLHQRSPEPDPFFPIFLVLPGFCAESFEVTGYRLIELGGTSTLGLLGAFRRGRLRFL